MTQAEKHKMKNDIIADIYESGIIQSKVAGMAYRNRISPGTQIADDVVHEVFYQLCKKSADEIIEKFTKNPKMLIGLLVRIAIWKGFARHPNGYIRHSLAQHILFGSVYQNGISLSPTESRDNETDVLYKVLIDPTSESTPTKEMWEVVCSNLSEDELDQLEDYLTKKPRGHSTKVSKEKSKVLLEKIKQIIIENNIKVVYEN